MDRLKLNRKWPVPVAAAVLLAGGVAFYFWRIGRSVDDERERQNAAARIEVSETRLRPPSTDGLTIYLNASDVRAASSLAGVNYLATSGGLIALDQGGGVKRRYTTLDGLPDNDLTSLATFRGRLFIGTATHGLIAFDGNVFTGYGFIKPKAAQVQTLAATDSELLIGTLDGGLFEYDGERFSRRFNSIPGADFKQVTALLPYESRLYIGTQDKGLYVWREAHIDHIGTGDGLPSPHVTALVPFNGSSSLGNIAVATDFGVVGLNDENAIKPISNRPNITSLAVGGRRLWAGLFGGGVVDLNAGDTGATGSGSPDVTGLPGLVPAIVYAGEGRLWALTREGAFARDDGAPSPAFEPVAPSLAAGPVLTTGHVTSLAIDGMGRLWVGSFDRGLDTIAPETSERLSHIEDDRVREINFVRYDPRSDQVFAATSRGLIAFDTRLKQTVMTREQGGLINNSVAHVTFADVTMPVSAIAHNAAATTGAPDRAIVAATAGGLTEISGGRARSLTAFHGLASNHLYTSAVADSRLFVGSLAGLVELDGLTVVRTYKTSNSQISNDWVTALCEADGTLYIGTNGGGVDALLPTGEWISFADEIGRFEVNQNAMHFDGERLFAGSSERGLLVYNTRGRRWIHFNSGLPSQNVTAITSDDRYVYVGTLNGLLRIEKRVVQ
jgi:ligand-binding sensor domain-containing protein